jgi:hypothetical protein
MKTLIVKRSSLFGALVAVWFFRALLIADPEWHRVGDFADQATCEHYRGLFANQGLIIGGQPVRLVLETKLCEQEERRQP